MNRQSQAKCCHAISLWIGILCLVLIGLFGPFILLTYPLQKWASHEIWNARDRWNTIKGFAAFGLLMYLPLFLLRGQVVSAWQQITLLGSASFTNYWVRTCLTIGLVPLATCLLEQVHPLTNWSTIRIRRAQEPAPVALIPPPAPKPENAGKRKKPKKVVDSAPSTPPAPSTRTPTKKTTKRTYDPRPLGEVLYEEKVRRQANASTDSPQQPEQLAPSSSPMHPDLWDEGEGTYRDH